MPHHGPQELRRRSLVKSLLWRVIGVVWTWVGAYLILLLIPPSRRSAALIATVIVVYHHSTRMVMYYAYERIWASVSWGRCAAARPMSRREKLMWALGTIVALGLIFLLLLHVGPKIKAKQSAPPSPAATSQLAPGQELLESGRSFRYVRGTT